MALPSSKPAKVKKVLNEEEKTTTTTTAEKNDETKRNKTKNKGGDTAAAAAAVAVPGSPLPSAQEEALANRHLSRNAIRYSILRLLQLPPEAWLRFSLYNGSLTRVEIRSDGLCSVRCVSDAGFMKPEEISFN